MGAWVYSIPPLAGLDIHSPTTAVKKIPVVRLYISAKSNNTVNYLAVTFTVVVERIWYCIYQSMHGIDFAVYTILTHKKYYEALL